MKSNFRNVLVAMMALAVVGVLAYGVFFSPIIPMPDTRGAESVTFSTEVESGAYIEGMSTALNNGDMVDFKLKADAYRKHLNEGEVKYSESKKALDALDALVSALEGGWLDKNDSRITNLWIQLIRVAANIDPSQSIDQNSEVVQNKFVPYYEEVASLKMKFDTDLIEEVEPDKRNRFLERKARYEKQCDVLLTRIDRKMHNETDPIELEEELDFLNEALQNLRQAGSDIIENHAS